MGLFGMGAGGAAGWVATGGNPLGAAGGAYVGNYLEGKLGDWIGGGDGGDYQPGYTGAVDYGGQTIDYASNRSQVDSREIPLDYSLANADRQRTLGDRARQAEAYQLSLAAAQGQTPSVAEMQMLRGQELAAQQGANLAASARGGGGASLYAQQMAQQQAAMGSAAATRDAGILRAQEMAQARGEVGGMANSMRQAGQGDRQMSEQRAIAEAQARLANRSANDERSMGLLQAQQADRRAKAEYEAGNWDRTAAQYNAAMGANAGADTAAANRGAQREAAAIGAGGALLGSSYASKKDKLDAEHHRHERGREPDLRLGPPHRPAPSGGRHDVHGPAPCAEPRRRSASGRAVPSADRAAAPAGAAGRPRSAL